MKNCLYVRLIYVSDSFYFGNLLDIWPVLSADQQ